MPTVQTDPLKQAGASVLDVLEVAQWTRRWLEELNTSKKCFSADLGGACTVGALLNTRLLQHILGIECKMVMAITGFSGHCWTELTLDGTQHVLDVTATQFGSTRFPKLCLETKQAYEEQDLIQEFMENVWEGEAAVARLGRWSPHNQPMTYMADLRRAFPDIAHLMVHATSDW